MKIADRSTVEFCLKVADRAADQICIVVFEQLFAGRKCKLTLPAHRLQRTLIGGAIGDYRLQGFEFYSITRIRTLSPLTTDNSIMRCTACRAAPSDAS